MVGVRAVTGGPCTLLTASPAQELGASDSDWMDPKSDPETCSICCGCGFPIGLCSESLPYSKILVTEGRGLA